MPAPQHGSRLGLRLEKEAWVRFCLAIFGLGLAFAAALFSTVTRHAGQTWATVILASSALLLAGVVGLTSVPYLVRRVGLQRVREAFEYEITREGLVYLGLILLIGIAALNTGNNLLFIIVSAMLAAIVVSGLASAVMLRGLSLRVALPEDVFAGTSILARVSLQNARTTLPAFSVSIVPPGSKVVRRFCWQGSIFAFPSSRWTAKQWLHLPDVALKVVSENRSEAAIFEQREYFPYLPARSTVPRDVQLLFARRGRYQQDEFGLSTRFPFSFLTKTRRVAFPPQGAIGSSGAAVPSDGGTRSRGHEMVVYPSVEPTDELFHVLPMITGEFESFVRGRGHDLYRIREYLPEDSARHVDWKATARSGGLKVKEFTREDERKLRIVFDNPGAESVSLAAYERGVALAASLAWHFAGQGTDLSFAASGFAGSTDIYEFLSYLALVQPAPRGGESEALLQNLQLSDDYNVVFTARPRGSIATELWACSYLVFLQESKQG